MKSDSDEQTAGGICTLDSSPHYYDSNVGVILEPQALLKRLHGGVNGNRASMSRRRPSVFTVHDIPHAVPGGTPEAHRIWRISRVKVVSASAHEVDLGRLGGNWHKWIAKDGQRLAVAREHITMERRVRR